MKIEDHVFLALFMTLTGCVGELDGGGTPLSSSGALASMPPPTVIQQLPKLVIPPRIKRWLTMAKIDFSQAEAESGLYRLTVESLEPMTADQLEFVPVYFRNRVAESFANRNALDQGQVTVAILSEKFEAKVYQIVATACGINDVSLAYDPLIRKGTLSMKIRNGDFEGTRKIIRQHIETIVQDKNIRIVTGVPPPRGRYYLLDESVKPGNVLEIKFKSE